ncbi:MAG: hypothetical protein UE295_12075 [Acutalibacteraceae bacterium]|nr:hypothetical protein [Acutalibacteraceae bacterium]
MALVLNQSGISPKAGDSVYAPYPARAFKLSSSLAAPVGPATPCKLAGTASNGMPVVTPITATSDVVYCVIATNLRTGSFGANDVVKGWCAGQVIWLTASASITAGAKVSAAVNGTVATANATPVLGIAESSASASGDLVAVRLVSPYDVQ